MTRIVLVRHGQTGWNIGAGGVRFRGRTDLALDETGLAQAQALAERLSDFPIAAIYSSPLQRAVQTAKPIAERLGISIQPISGFIDINYGDWQGKTPEEVAEDHPDVYRMWLDKPHLVEFPNGESLAKVRIRTVAALEELIARHKDQTILLMAHQVVNKVLICAMLGLDNSHFWRIRQDNGCINIFEYQEEMSTAVLINDTCHLQGQGATRPRAQCR